MRKHFLLLIIVLVAISLGGLIFTQIFWLNRSVSIAESHYDDRADRMLEDVVSELQQYADTSSVIKYTHIDELNFFDVIDTTLLDNLLRKYINYHMLDSSYYYALIRTYDNYILYHTKDFNITMEEESYKACLSCIWKKEYIHISVYFPTRTLSIYKQIFLWILLSVFFILIVISVFSFVIYSLIQQKKISEIRNDFINNMTHEFKTPISTISLASEMLMKDAARPSKERIRKYSRIIYEENKRMQSQVDLVLQTALIEREHIKLKKEESNIHEVIIAATESFSIDAAKTNVKFELELTASSPRISFDPTHIRNVLNNIIDNGIKYSGPKPFISITTRDTQDGILIQIRDNGRGISREAQHHIFEKFYRISTGDVHDVKGFGLGLYYVKTIVEAHKGSVYVRSILNKGSSFNVFLPKV